MLFSIDPTSERPVFEQIADSVRRQLAISALVAGDRLPPAHDVALGLDVNKHTVLRAYQQLRDEGLVDLRRGRGAVITAAATALAEIAHEVRTLTHRAEQLGITPDTLAALISQTPSHAHKTAKPEQALRKDAH